MKHFVQVAWMVISLMTFAIGIWMGMMIGLTQGTISSRPPAALRMWFWLIGQNQRRSLRKNECERRNAMQEQMPNRTVVAEFFKDRRGIVRVNNLTVIQEERGRVHKEIWDVDYSRKFGYILHMSGAGGSISPIEVRGIYHVSGKGNPKIVEKEPQWVDSRDSDPFDDKPRTLAVRNRNRTRRIAKLPKAIDLQPEQDMLDWLQSNGIEGDSVWCSVCRDCFPGTDDWNLCNHCWWCDKTGNYSTPDERCDCNSREECNDR